MSKFLPMIQRCSTRSCDAGYAKETTLTGDTDAFGSGDNSATDSMTFAIAETIAPSYAPSSNHGTLRAFALRSAHLVLMQEQRAAAFMLIRMRSLHFTDALEER